VTEFGVAGRPYAVPNPTRFVVHNRNSEHACFVSYGGQDLLLLNDLPQGFYRLCEAYDDFGRGTGESKVNCFSRQNGIPHGPGTTDDTSTTLNDHFPKP
jgi:hypothetical protein